SQQRNRIRMQPEFGLVHEDYRGLILPRLQEQSGQRDKSERAIRKRRSAEISIRTFVPPFKSDCFFIERVRPKLEVIEKRSNTLDRSPNQSIRVWMALAQKVEEGGQIRAVGSQKGVVIDLRRFAHR